MPSDWALPIFRGPFAHRASTTRSLPDPSVLSLTQCSMCQPPGNLCHRPSQPSSLLMTTSVPDTHQPLTIPCSTAGGTLPLRTYAPSVSLKPPSPHPQAGRAPSSPEAAVSCPLTPAERGRPAGQPVIREDGPCSHNLFSGNCQGRVESWKKTWADLGVWARLPQLAV